MTHSKGDAQRIAELNSAFVTLNGKGKDSALAILRALSFAQAVMGADICEEAGSAVHRQTAMDHGGRIGAPHMRRKKERSLL